MTLARRLEKLKAAMQAKEAGDRSPLLFRIDDWIDYPRRGFPEEEAESLIAHYEPLALERLVGVGKIQPQDR